MIKPTLPKPESLTGRALARLMQSRQLTHRDFQNETATYRLSSNIEQLRKTHNWQIAIEFREDITRDPTGRKARYGVYSITPETLHQARKALSAERFDNFIEAVKKFEEGADDKA